VGKLETLNGYTLGALLGKAGEGSVYEATSPGGVKVALKIFDRSETVSGNKISDTFSNLQQVDSPFVVEVIEYFVHESKPVFVMEYIEGSSLEQLMKSGEHLEYELVIGTMSQVALGLRDLHAAGYLHGEINNQGQVMIQPNGGAKLIDVHALTAAEDTKLGEVRHFGALIFNSLSHWALITPFCDILESTEEIHPEDFIKIMEKGEQLAHKNHRKLKHFGYFVEEWVGGHGQIDFEALKVVHKLTRFGKPGGYQTLDEASAELSLLANKKPNEVASSQHRITKPQLSVRTACPLIPESAQKQSKGPHTIR